MSEYDLIVAGFLGGMALMFGMAAFVIAVLAVVSLVRQTHAEDEQCAAIDDEVTMAEVIRLGESRRRDRGDGAA